MNYFFSSFSLVNKCPSILSLNKKTLEYTMLNGSITNLSIYYKKEVQIDKSTKTGNFAKRIDRVYRGFVLF